MTVTDAPGEDFVRLRTGATTAGRGYKVTYLAPTPVRHARLVVVDPKAGPSDEQLQRAYVSRLWSEDWDSEEDSVYDAC